MSKTTIDDNGTKYWHKNGQLHREDGPAVVEPDGTEWWYRNGQLHREDGPAIIRSDGTEYWFRNAQPCAKFEILLRCLANNREPREVWS
jgi:hypothetical protein